MVGLRVSDVPCHYKNSNVLKNKILPQEIIDLIVREFSISYGGIDRRRRGNGTVRRNLGRRLTRLHPIAAVNRIWRRATIPLLYAAVVCEQQQIDGVCNWRTNVKMFSEEQSSFATQLVVITRRCCTMEDMIGLCTTLAREDFRQQNWSNLCTLQFAAVDDNLHHPTVDMRHMIVEDNLRYSGISLLSAFVLSSQQQSLSRNCSSLGCVDKIPLLLEVADCLQLRIPLPSHGVSTCRVDLLHAHATSLPLHSKHIPHIVSYSALKELSVQYNGSDTLALLAATASTLTDLRLLSIPSEFISDALALGSVTQQSTFQKLHQPSFAQLRSLNLQFSDDATSLHSRGQSIVETLASCAADFPQLRKLTVRNPPVDVRAVVGAFYRRKCHSNLRQFEVECSVALVGNIMALDFGHHVDGAESVAVGCVGLGQLAPERADRMAKQMLESVAHGLRRMRLTIAAQLPVRLGGVVMECSQLRSLELRMPVTLADVAAVVQQLPCLWKLKAPYIATANLPSDEVRSLDRFYALMTACPSQKLLKPISRSLEIVHVGFWDYRHSARALCCHLLHFIVRLPTLRTLVHDAQSAIALQSAVDALALIHQRQSRWSSQHTHSTTFWLNNLCDLRITTHSVKPF